MAFVDQEKVFDKVNRNLFWQILKRYGISEHLITLCQSLCTKCTSVIRTKNGISNPFDITLGVRQGCVLSPSLLLAYIDSITKAANVTIDNGNEIHDC
jgi:hypothetical protein